MRTYSLDPGARLPLVVSPEHADGAGDAAGLTRWAARHRPEVEALLGAHGAVLYRGFGFDSPAAFEAFASAIASMPMDYVGGVTPRQHVAGSVYTSTEAHRVLPIPPHCEMSYLARYPARVLFFCQTPPRRGGQTPLVDMRRVYRALDPAVRQAFAERGVRHVRTLHRRRTLLDPKTWPEMFGTEDRAAVEAHCRREGSEFEWRRGGALRLIRRTASTIAHPGTGERVWFNQVNVFHDSWSWELRRAGSPLLAAFAASLEARRRRQNRPEDGPSHCTFGDGSAIPLDDVLHVRRVLWEHVEVFDWQRGDVLLLDNRAVGHGRMPYGGPRRVLALLAEPAGAV
jgi:alpha-ketoglutarate-dependent taurine dioxygenase